MAIEGECKCPTTDNNGMALFRHRTINIQLLKLNIFDLVFTGYSMQKMRLVLTQWLLEK